MADAVDDVPWGDIAPAAIKIPYYAYKHRHLVQKLWQKLVFACGAGATDIVITGRTAVGKSVLHGKLSGTADEIAFDLPDASVDVEGAVINVSDWARIVRVIPGQTSQERDKGIHEAFSTHETLEGIIHVVDWGFTPERDEVVREKRITEEGLTTIEKIREFNLRAELRDLEIVCERVRESYARCGRPKWLMIAVSKCDLFMDKLAQAQSYYRPDGNSPFAKQLQSLLLEVGKQNLQCMASPVSSWDSDFTWNNEKVASNVGGTSNARSLLRNFINNVAILSSKTDQG